MPLNRRQILSAAPPLLTRIGVVNRQSVTPETYHIVVTNSTGSTVTFLDPAGEITGTVEVGSAPWGAVLAADGLLSVTCGAGLAIVDPVRQHLETFVPYQSVSGEGQFGEYRPGGMALVANPESDLLYVGVYQSSGPSIVEVFDRRQRKFVAQVPVGIRPFGMLIAPDGSEIYSLDHDSYTVTVIDAATLSTRTVDAAPLGYGGFDKPHEGAVSADGTLLLPFQGRLLWELDPATGEGIEHPLTGDSHQHGTLITASQTLYIVGTGPAGSATGGPDLTIYDLEAGAETVIPLDRPHEAVAVSPDERLIYLTGGYTFANDGWDGLTIIDRDAETVSEVAVPDRPLGIAIIPASSEATPRC